MKSFGTLEKLEEVVSGWSHFENIDRFWGGEVLFSPDVDRAFV